MQTGGMLLDKTPRYIYYLDDILRRAPGVPVIVTMKDERSQLESWAKRGVKDNTHSKYATERYNTAIAGLERGLAAFPDRILVVNHTDVLDNTDAVLTKIFDFVGPAVGGPWRPEYKSLDAYKIKCQNAGLSTDHINALRSNSTRRRLRRKVPGFFHPRTMTVGPGPGPLPFLPPRPDDARWTHEDEASTLR